MGRRGAAGLQAGERLDISVWFGSLNCSHKIVRNRRRWASPESSANHATRRSGSAASHCTRSVVLPNPAGGR
jgi:hypothetical protein